MDEAKGDTPKTKTRQLDKRGFKKFLWLVAILAVYTGYLVFHFGSQGLLLGFLTWSAFVLATPIADAGILLDLPIRYFLGWKMVATEVFVWAVAILGNLLAHAFAPQVYGRTKITFAFHEILDKPWPNWTIIVVSCIGTFGSLFLADRVFDLVGQGRFKKTLQNSWHNPSPLL